MTRFGSCAAALVLAVTLAPGVSFAQDSTLFAQQRLSRGVQAYDAHDYARALEEFQASLQLYESPNTRLYLARSLRELGRLPEAIAQYERTAREAGDRAQTDTRYVPTRDAATNELRAVSARVGHVTLAVPEVPAGARVQLAGREVPVAALGVPIPVMPGHVEATVEADGFAPARAEADVTAGGEVALTVRLERLAPAAHPAATSAQAVTVATTPAPSPPPVEHTGVNLRPAGVGIALVGVVGFASFIVFHTLADQQFQMLSAQCGHTACPESQRGAVDTGRTYQTLTDVSLGVGIAGVAVGALLFLLSPREHAPPVHVGLGPNGLSVGGVF